MTDEKIVRVDNSLPDEYNQCTYHYGEPVCHDCIYNCDNECIHTNDDQKYMRYQEKVMDKLESIIRSYGKNSKEYKDVKLYSDGVYDVGVKLGFFDCLDELQLSIIGEAIEPKVT